VLSEIKLLKNICTYRMTASKDFTYMKHGLIIMYLLKKIW